MNPSMPVGDEDLKRWVAFAKSSPGYHPLATLLERLARERDELRKLLEGTDQNVWLSRLYNGLVQAKARYEKAEAERDELRERSVKLEGEARIKGEFLSSRQCSDHNGKWERGRCLQCELEKATAALEGMKEDAARLDFVDRMLCRSGDVVDPSGKLTGIMKCWQVVTQLDESLRTTIDRLAAAIDASREHGRKG